MTFLVGSSLLLLCERNDDSQRRRIEGEKEKEGGKRRDVLFSGRESRAFLFSTASETTTVSDVGSKGRRGRREGRGETHYSQVEKDIPLGKLSPSPLQAEQRQSAMHKPGEEDGVLRVIRRESVREVGTSSFPRAVLMFDQHRSEAKPHDSSAYLWPAYRVDAILHT